MKLREALKRNLVFKTEYGAGPKLGGGIFSFRKFRRQNYRLDGGSQEDTVYERALDFGFISNFPDCSDFRHRQIQSPSGEIVAHVARGYVCLFGDIAIFHVSTVKMSLAGLYCVQCQNVH